MFIGDHHRLDPRNRILLITRKGTTMRNSFSKPGIKDFVSERPPKRIVVTQTKRQIKVELKRGKQVLDSFKCRSYAQSRDLYGVLRAYWFDRAFESSEHEFRQIHLFLAGQAKITLRVAHNRDLGASLSSY